MGPPSEWPTRTYGPGSPDAVSNALRSTAESFAVAGCATGVDRLRSNPVWSLFAVEVPGRSWAQPGVNFAPPGTTGRSGWGVVSFVVTQSPARSPLPATSTTVGLPA